MKPSARSLLVLPEDSIDSVLRAIHQADTCLDVKMFSFSEPRLMASLIAAHRRGVHVRVMLNPSRRSGYADNEVAFRELVAAGIAVRETHPAYEVSHEKSLVVDQSVVFIQSFNWTEDNLAKRDYAIVTSWRQEVDEVLHVFDADWNRQDDANVDDLSLIWCRGNGRKRFGDFIDQAAKNLLIQNERIYDLTILEHLVRAQFRGVHVQVLARSPHHLKPKKLLDGIASLMILHHAGVKVHHAKQFPLHAKMMVADHRRAIVGSVNFSPGSFDHRRELAIEVDDQPIIKRLGTVFKHDWKHSDPIKLSDRAILKTLEHHHRDNLKEIVTRQEFSH